MKPSALLLPLFSAALIHPQPDIQGTVTEPEYIGVVAAIDPSTGALIELERHPTTQRVKIKGLGFGGGEVYLKIPGERSAIRFRADAVPAFVVRVTSQQSDPQSSIRLIGWKVEKRSRQISVQKAGALGLNATSSAEESLLPFNVTKYGEASLKIVSAQPLPPGEYAFGPPDGHDSFSFGIDPAGGENPLPPSVSESAGSNQRVINSEATTGGKESTFEKPLTNDDVIGMFKAGLEDDIILAKIQQAPAEALDASTDALIRLKKEGLSKPVIDAVLRRVSQRK
jgi:hypothetical protein